MKTTPVKNCNQCGSPISIREGQSTHKEDWLQRPRAVSPEFETLKSRVVQAPPPYQGKVSPSAIGEKQLMNQVLGRIVFPEVVEQVAAREVASGAR